MFDPLLDYLDPQLRMWRLVQEAERANQEAERANQEAERADQAALKRALEELRKLRGP